MRVREYQQESADDMGTSGTLTYPLDFTDPITEICLRFAATNGATSNINNPIERNISKIEIVDGGEVLWSMPGDVAFAAAAHFANAMPHGYRTGAVGDAPYQVIPIRFGRYPFDPEYAFNPSAHRNPQLKVTFDEATVRAASATGFVSNSFTMDLNVRLMEDAPVPVGFLSLREIETYTSLASGNVITRLPSDRVIRALLVRAYESAVDFRSCLTNFKLSSDGGKFVNFDLPVRTMVDYMTEAFRPVMIPQYTWSNDGQEHETWVGIDLEAFSKVHQGQIIHGSTEAWPSQMKLYFANDAGVVQNAQACHFGVIGWAVHNTLIYPFGRLDVPEDWLAPQSLANLDLTLAQGDASEEVNVCLQQVYPY